MRTAKLECARAVRWMREIEARDSVPENRDASISSCKFVATRCKFRSVSSSSNDRGIGIGRIGVEKPTLDFTREINGAPAKHCSGPENRDASISSGKRMSSRCKFRSFSIDRGIGIDRIGVEETTFDFFTLS